MNSYKAHMKKETRQTGFTLVELMIVVVIILILAFVAAPAAKSMFDRKKVNDAAEELFSFVYMARSEAAARSMSVYFIVDDSSGMSLALDQDSVSSSPACVPSTGVNCSIVSPSSVNAGDVTLFATNLDVKLKTDVKEIEFDPFDSTAVKTEEDAAEKTSEGGAADMEFNLSLEGVAGSYCKKVTVGYLGQLHVNTGTISGNLCQ